MKNAKICFFDSPIAAREASIQYTTNPWCHAVSHGKYLAGGDEWIGPNNERGAYLYDRTGRSIDDDEIEGAV